MRFFLLGSLALAAGSASAQGLFDFEDPALEKRADSDVRYDSCGIPLRSTWSRHGKYSRHGSASKKRSCEERRAAYHDQSALASYNQKSSGQGDAASSGMVKASRAASPTSWEASSQSNTWLPDTTSTQETNTWKAASSSAAPSSSVNWNQNAAQQQNTWTSSDPVWSSSEAQSDSSSSQEWENTWSSSAAAEPTSSAKAQAKVRVANYQQPQQADAASSESAEPSSSEEAAEPTSSSSSSTSSSGSSHGKRGLAWAVDNNWAPTIATDRISWAYHWQDAYIPTLPSDVDFYPMLYSGQQSDVDQFYAAIKSMPSTPKYILGPNEPDIPSQANMSPQEAATAWKSYMQPYADQGVQLCTPAIAYKIDWLQQFMDACDGCTISCVAIHSYDDYDPSFSQLKQRIQDTHSAFPQYDIWVTEFGLTSASNPTSDQVVQYLSSASDYMEGLDYVKKYAFFGAWATNPDGYASSNSAFFDENGSLSAVGQWYANN